MTIDELLGKLAELRLNGVPADAEVITEGCDCDGLADDVIVFESTNNVLITRR